MATINPDWYAGNATRAYPLDDAATVRDDAGRELPPQILVDCRVQFPAVLGRFAYVGGVTVGPGIVTVILMATSARPGRLPAQSVPAPDQPLGAVSLPVPVVPYRHYPIQPMAAGVGGWLVFGRGIDEPYSGRFSMPGQSMLLPRVASAYDPLPIPTLGKLGLDPPLTGVVQLLGGTDLEVVQDIREIDGGIVDAIVIRLVDSLNRNVFGLYTGPCGGRPESDTCTKPVVESINSVMPDCDGNLTIDFSGAASLPVRRRRRPGPGPAAGHGRRLPGPGLPARRRGEPARRLRGHCPPPVPPVIEGPGGPTVPPPGGVLPPIPSGCTPMPYYDSFDGPPSRPRGSRCPASSPSRPTTRRRSPTAWRRRQRRRTGARPGAWTARADRLPGVMPLSRAARSRCPPTAARGRSRPARPPSWSPIDQSYGATDPTQRNVSIWNCDYDSSNPSGITMTTHFKMMPGPQINGGHRRRLRRGPDQHATGRPADLCLHPGSTRSPASGRTRRLQRLGV